jgi:hypothetical protein
MLPAATRTAIFTSLPRTVTLDNDQLDIYIDYADRVNVTKALKEHDIVVTLRYFADRPDVAATPANRVFRREVVGDDVRYTRGERARVTLGIQVHAADTPARPGDDLVTAYLAALQVWYLRDLPAIVEVVGRSEIPDLSYLDDHRRRGMDIFLRYAVTYTETVPSIETVEHDVAVERDAEDTP